MQKIGRKIERNVPKFIEDFISSPENYLALPNITPFWPSQVEEIKNNFIKIQKQIPNIIILEKFSKNFRDVLIVGDIHGDLKSLIRIIQPFLKGKVESIIFLGDYVDRGDYNFQCLMLVVCLVITWPKRIILLRGNHEDIDLNIIFGFYQDLQEFYPINEEVSKVIEYVEDIYNHMSLIAITHQNSICVHAGIPKKLLNIKQFFKFPKPHDSVLNRSDLLYSDLNEALDEEIQEAFIQIRWNDPTLELRESDARSYHGYYYYSEEELIDFLIENNKKRIIKSHESLRGGYHDLFEHRLIHIFSNEPYFMRIDKAYVIHETRDGKTILRDLDFTEIFEVENPPERET